MKRLNLFSSNPYIVYATIQQFSMYIFRNFDKVIRILVEIAKDNKCVICDDLSLNYSSKASLGNHLYLVHKKRTMEYFRDYIMILSPDEIEELMKHD